MARMSVEQAQAAIVDALQGAGGEAAYADLLTSLETAGAREAAGHLRNLVQSGVVASRVVWTPGTKAQLRYTVQTSQSGGGGGGD